MAVAEHCEEKLPTLLEGCNLCNIFNMYKTGFFFCTTEYKTLHQKGQECSGGKKAYIWLYLFVQIQSVKRWHN